MDAGDVVLLARTLGIEVPGGEIENVGETEMAENEMETETNVEQSGSCNTAFIADDSALNDTLNDLNSRNDAGVQLVASDPTEEDNSHDGIISAFCDITGSDLESAGHLLEVCNWTFCIVGISFKVSILIDCLFRIISRLSVGIYKELFQCTWKTLRASLLRGMPSPLLLSRVSLARGYPCTLITVMIAMKKATMHLSHLVRRRESAAATMTW